MQDLTRACSAAALAVLVLGACSQPVPPAVAPTAAPPPVSTTPQATVEARFDPTAAIGGGASASTGVTDAQLKAAFAAVQQATQLTFSANSSPAGATGSEVASISVRAEDKGGMFKSLDVNAKRALGEALLNAAGATWPGARITLLVTDAAGTSGQIIGSRPPGGPNTIIAS